MSTPPQRPIKPTPPGGGRAQPGARSPHVERAMAVRDVMDHAVRVQKEITAITPLRASRGRSTVAVALCVPLLAFCMYSYMTRPAFIWGARTEPSPIKREADLRFGMYLLAQRVESHREQTGNYPESLEAIGAALDGVSYTLTSPAAFELRAMDHGVPLVFRSTEPVDAFLGNSPAIIQGLAR